MSTQTQPVPTGAMAEQPVISVTAITTLVSAVFAGVVLAVPGINQQWEQIIIGIIVAAWPVITAAWTWHKVVSPKTATEAVNAAVQTGTAPDPMDPAQWAKLPAPEPIRGRVPGGAA